MNRGERGGTWDRIAVILGKRRGVVNRDGRVKPFDGQMYQSQRERDKTLESYQSLAQRQRS